LLHLFQSSKQDANVVQVLNDKEDLQSEIAAVLQRKYRSFDIYMGPVHIGILDEIPGAIRKTNGDKKTLAHP